MVSCGTTGSTNRADKNFSIIILVTIIIIMLLRLLYHSVFRTLAHLMHEKYSKPCQTSKTMRYIENHGIAETVYSGIFRYTQEHSAIFSHVQAH